MYEVFQKKLKKITTEPGRSVAEAVIKALLIAELFYGQILLALLVIPLTGRIIKAGRRKYEADEIRRLGSCFKDALTAISFSIEVGYSPENAIKESVNQLRLVYGDDARIVTDLEKMVRKIDMNIPVEVAMEEFATESRNSDIQYFAHIFTLAKKSGGNLAQVLRNTAQRIGKKLEVQAEIDTIISGKKMEQKVMEVIPYGMIMYLRMTTPELVAPMYGNLLGIIVMTICLAVCLVAHNISGRIMRIEV